MEETGSDLQVIKLVDNPTPNLNSEVVWTVLVVNNGPETAENVVVHDNLPAGVEYDSHVAGMGSFDASAGRWEIGDLGDGESVMLQITTIATNAAVAQTNIALVSSDTEDSDPSNNVDTAEIDAVAADLSLDKGVIPETATVQDEVEWTLTIANNGPDDATGVVVEDVLPAGVDYVSDTSDGAFDADSGEWIVGDLASGEDLSMTITATIVDVGEIVNLAQVVASDQFDPDSTADNFDPDRPPEDDEDSAVVTVPEIIDLELTQTISSNTAEVGDNVTFTITVFNNSTVPASGVSVASQLPELFADGTLTFVEASDAGVFAAPGSDWNIGEIGGGETVELTIEATINAPGEITNIAQVSAADQEDDDSTPGNYNDAPDEDDGAVVSVVVPDPNPVPEAIDDSFELVGTDETINAVIMVDHSGSMGTKITTVNGDLQTRLDAVKGAIEDFATREHVGAIKIMGFDGQSAGEGGDSVRETDVSTWLDVSGENPDLMQVTDFLEGFVRSGRTNYLNALKATQTHTTTDAFGNDDPVPEGLINYYFLTDGVPNPADGEPLESAVPVGAQLVEWESFVEENFNESYAIGFGGIRADDEDLQGKTLDEVISLGLDLVAHPNTPRESGEVDGLVRDEENSIVVNDADEIPAEFFRTVADSIEGNVFDNDDSGPDGQEFSDAVISELDVAGVVYAFDGTSAILKTGEAPETSFVNGTTINTPTPSGGRLEFDLSDGSFEYFAPFGSAALTESFDYTISDGTGDTATATLTVEVKSIDESPALLADSDDMFTSIDTSDAALLPSGTLGQVADTSGTSAESSLFVDLNDSSIPV